MHEVQFLSALQLQLDHTIGVPNSCLLRSRLCLASTARALARATYGADFATPRPRTHTRLQRRSKTSPPSRIMTRRPIATQGLLGVAPTSESPCRSGVVASAARERARCELPAVVPLVMSAAMSQLSCRVAHSLQHSSMLSSRQLVHVGGGCGALQLLKPQGRTWHNCKLSDLSDA